MWNEGKGFNKLGTCKNVTFSNKIDCLTRKQDRSPNSGLIEFDDFCRFLTRRELELAQTVPVGYTDCVSYNQAQDLLGDGWTVEVITNILKGIK
jgi:DNA (cytosine-5)-methyltransferase 3A